MDIQFIPTVLTTIAWGCSLNMLVFGAHAIKEGWNVPSVSFMSAPRILGRVGMFCSMCVAAWAAGWWSIPIAIGGGLLFAGISTTVLRESTLTASLGLGLVSNIAAVIYLIFI